MITVKYYGNPDKVVNDHIGNYFDMIEYCSKDFNDEAKALAFLNQCTRPITTLGQILTKDTSIKKAEEILHKTVGFYGIDNPFEFNNN